MNKTVVSILSLGLKKPYMFPLTFWAFAIFVRRTQPGYPTDLKKNMTLQLQLGHLVKIVLDEQIPSQPTLTWVSLVTISRAIQLYTIGQSKSNG